jgi:hypothetical protein
VPSATGALGDRKKETVLPAATMLGYADLACLEAAGVEIGAHSHSPPDKPAVLT